MRRIATRRGVLVLGAVVLFGVVASLGWSKEGALASDLQVEFVDVAERSGIRDVVRCGTLEKRHILESGGSGVLLFDFDDDGWLDVYIIHGDFIDQENRVTHFPNRLYRNQGSWKFTDVTESAGVGAEEWGTGGAVGDMDGDGDLDLYVTNFGPNRLYRNDGNGKFTDVSEESGAQADGWSTGVSFFDAEKDGDLDLYVASYVDCDWDSVMTHHPKLLRGDVVEVLAGPQGYPGGADRFFRNDGKGHFTEATAEAGFDTGEKLFGFSVATGDLDEDGDVDVYVANDAGHNFWFQNDGKGKFTDVSLWTGVGFSEEGISQAGMGVEIGDINADGRPDLVVTNFAFQYNTLYRNLGNGLFEDATSRAGLADTAFRPMGWGVALFDLDCDADLDLFVANGHIYPQLAQHPELGESFRQKNLLYLNHEGMFTEISESAGSGLQVVRASRGAAVGDLDNDGDLDVVISNMDDPVTVLENRSGSGNWLLLRLTGKGALHGIGARIELTVAGQVQDREIRSGSSYLSQNDLRAHFGLGSAQKADRIEIIWPDGSRQTLENISANQVLDVAKTAENEP